jgi:glycine dehydrogenase subunit 1
MRYIPNTEQDREAMLQAIGVGATADLFASVPERVRLARPLRIPRALSEAELVRHMRELAGRNAEADGWSSFLGAGCYNHFSPAVIHHLVSRGEFLTAYTPYQPEISQGTLQALYEYQTLVCLLTGMDVSNASMYEGASATAEAILMAHRITGRSRVVLARAVHPEYRHVARTYGGQIGLDFSEIPVSEAGATDPALVPYFLSDQTACLVVQSPNFFGGIEDLDALVAAAHAVGALCIVTVTEPVALGLLKPPGASGADIVAGEAQGLGTGLNYGGPALGFFATRDQYVRHLPGRLVGETVDREGRRGYVLTLATREQHIRREKATSNICTSESLIAFMATMYLVSLGPQGLREVAALNLNKAEFAKQLLTKLPGVAARFSGPTFNEFVLRTDRPPARILKQLQRKRILAGVDLGRFYPEYKDCLLVCVTEQHRREEIEALARSLRDSCGPGKGPRDA